MYHLRGPPAVVSQLSRDECGRMPAILREPSNLDIDPDFAPGVYQAGHAHVEAFSAAMGDAGYDVNAYELSRALDAALSDASARERFESRLKPFAGLGGEEVPAEFDDLED